MSSANIIIAALSGLLVLALVAAVMQWRRRQGLARRFKAFNEHLHEVSADASIGRRMSAPEDPDAAVLAQTINRLFDALGERDQKIQGRDRLFRDFSRTTFTDSGICKVFTCSLPEVVVNLEARHMQRETTEAGGQKTVAGTDFKNVLGAVQVVMRARFKPLVVSSCSGLHFSPDLVFGPGGIELLLKPRGLREQVGNRL